MAEPIRYERILPQGEVTSFDELAETLTLEETTNPKLLENFGWSPERARRVLDDHGIVSADESTILDGELPPRLVGLRLDIVAAWVTIARSRQPKRLEGVISTYSRALLHLTPQLRPVYAE